MKSPPALLSVFEVKRVASELKKDGKRIVFTNGCFDLFHAGHAALLAFARLRGDVLFVGLNSDNSVRRIKGPGRPLQPQLLRAQVLLACRHVDYVVIFEEDTPFNLIRILKPHVLVKGADWKGKEVVGSTIVRESGGEVVFAPLVEGLSTSALIEKIRRGSG